MRRTLVFLAIFGLISTLSGCGEGMWDASLKADVTGKGPSEPGGPAKFPDDSKPSPK